MDDAADGNIVREERLEELMRDQARAQKRQKRQGDAQTLGSLRFEPAAIAGDIFVSAKPKAAQTQSKAADKKKAKDEDIALDEDEINMSELEELMEDLSMEEEEIEDEISHAQVRRHLQRQ